ncbi:proteasome accessory factor PafA2 family protein [Candidatus Saccharibacteria bacterium]|nr:proteasome accessory factor PafA2 family protein [Candidatus Saccharibacteria bacterium]
MVGANAELLILGSMMNEHDTSPKLYGIETEFTYTCEMIDTNILPEIGVVVEDRVVDLDNDIFGIFGTDHNDWNTGESGVVFDYDVFSKVLLGRFGLHRVSKGMLSNGGRLYEDPSGYEYCTPECSTAAEATLRSFDGDRILFGAFRYLQEMGHIGRFQINRRTVDYAEDGNSRGVHINTLTNRQSLNQSEIAILATLNIAKGALFGSGGLMRDRHGDVKFYHSPRLAISDSGISGSPARWTDRLLVRSLLKCDVGGYRRLETISGDALNFAWPLRASMVMTKSVLGLLEMGFDNIYILPHIQDADSRDTARRIGMQGAEGMMDVMCCLDDYYTESAANVLRQFAETCLFVDAQQTAYLDEEQLQVLNEVIDVLDMMDADRDSVAGVVESVARRQYLQRKMDQHNVDMQTDVICRADYAWDLVGGVGVAGLYRDKGYGWLGFDKRSYTPLASEARLTRPPNDTRAAVRGRAILDAVKLGKSIEFEDWGRFMVDNINHCVGPLEHKDIV